MLTLTFSTGIVDAVGYLGLDRVFTGNMTGNVVILGMAIAGSAKLPVLGPLLALAAFLIGAAFGGACQRGATAGWHRATTGLLCASGSVLAIVTVVLAVNAHPPRAVALAITAALGAAMGTQASAARHVGVPDVSTVVVTSTIVGLAADSWFGNRKGAHAPRRGGAAVLILAGAIIGALLLRWQPAAAVALAAALTLLVAALGHPLGAAHHQVGAER
jgi:uncharacterized membrane protein YoaK (UPF0700 family)